MTERGGFEALDPCVHCGFCLQACPTFLATGDEADSPRGRIDLMRALEAGELAPDDPALRLHLDRCLGCRGCEPVCPSGVGFGRGMEAARALLATRRRPSALARAALWALTSPGTSRTVYAVARMLRATGIPRRLAGWGRLRFAMGMLAATKPTRNAKRGTRNRRAGPSSAFRVPTSALLFRGCVMDGLFAHVHDATIRTLQVNGYSLREVPEQVCCGALHAHAGLRAEARLLARANVAAFGEGDEPIVVNSAGCGAMLKEYGHLVDAAGFTARVRDVTELLAAGGGPRPGAPVDVQVAYDPPCHLLHAQRIADEPLRVLAAIPVLRVMSLPDAAQCCGSAGLFTLLEPAMSRAVLAPKLASLRTAAPQVVATGNPGCLMQLGAGLAAGGLSAAGCHRGGLLAQKSRVYLELIDRSLALVPGAADFVPGAAERFRLGLVSGALRQEVELVLARAGLQRYFDVLVAAEDVEQCKPDPAGYLAARGALDRRRPLPPGHCVVIEDSLPGLRAARAAGMRCAMLTTSHPSPPLADAGADLVWSSFAGHAPAELLALADR